MAKFTGFNKEIQKHIDRYYNHTQQGQDELRAYRKKNRRNETAYLKNNVIEYYKGTILSALPHELTRIGGTRPIHKSDLSVRKTELKQDGTYEFIMTFKPSAVYRPSLYPAAFNGIDNIVDLFTTGYDISAMGGRHVHGYWHGVKTLSRLKRESDMRFFMAVINFNDYASVLDQFSIDITSEYMFGRWGRYTEKIAEGGNPPKARNSGQYYYTRGKHKGDPMFKSNIRMNVKK